MASACGCSSASTYLTRVQINLAGKANAAILEDDELMEKVKSDRKKRTEKQVVIGSSTEEKAYLQEKTEVDAVNSSFTSLISSVSANDVEGSKVAFGACASALEKWTVL